MPNLIQILQGNDLGFLRMVAGAWGIDLNAPDALTAQPVLVSALLNRALLDEVVEAMPEEAQKALRAVAQNEGRMAWALFARRFGEVRVFGPGRRDRERPDLKPASPAEVLWYRALIGKAFLNLPPEPQEYAFIPDDLLELLGPAAADHEPVLGRPASPGETAHPLPANDHILDHACTLLAALRLGMNWADIDTTGWQMPARPLLALLHAGGLLDASGQPLPDPTRSFLETPRAQALAWLARTWINSESFNDLSLVPGLTGEGTWRNHPLQARRALLDMLSRLPEDRWWNLASFTAGVFEHNPDFQRPAGDYDSWYIRRSSDNTFLRGIAFWDEVDGALIRWVVTGPLHWLGLFDLAAPGDQQPPGAFRSSRWAAALWHGAPPEGLAVENQGLKAGPDGLLRVSSLAPRAARYLIARFCVWEGEEAGEYRYRPAPAALNRAAQQGLKINHLTALLKKHSTAPLPPTLLQALEHWEKLGAGARVETAQLLRLSSPEALAALRQSRAARYLGEVLNPTTAVLKPGGQEAVQRALADLGYLVDYEEETRTISSQKRTKGQRSGQE